MLSEKQVDKASEEAADAMERLVARELLGVMDLIEEYGGACSDGSAERVRDRLIRDISDKILLGYLRVSKLATDRITDIAVDCMKSVTPNKE